MTRTARALTIEPMRSRLAGGAPHLRRRHRDRRRDARASVPDWNHFDHSHPVNAGSWPSTGGRAGRRLDGARRLFGRRVYAASPGRASTSAAEARGRRRRSALLEALIPASEAAGYWTLLAGVLLDNTASLALHEAVGFRRVGVQQGWAGCARPLARRRPPRAPEPDRRPLRCRRTVEPARQAVEHETLDRASRPRTSSVRRSRPFVALSVVAASTLTSNSPAAAADARRAVVLTTSPSAVKSSTAPAVRSGRRRRSRYGPRRPADRSARGRVGPADPLDHLRVRRAIAAAAWCGPETPPKNSPMISSPTSLSTSPSWSRIAFDPIS